MATIEELHREIMSAKTQSEAEFNTIKYTRDKNKVKRPESPLFKSKIIKITSKEEVYEAMKSRFRSNWKSSSYI